MVKPLYRLTNGWVISFIKLKINRHYFLFYYLLNSNVII